MNKITVKVNRKQTPQQMLDATGWKQYTDKEVVNSMPQGKATKVELEFFNVGKYVTDAELQKEYESRGLIPADPYELCATDVKFLDEKEWIGTHWKNKDGKWCFAVCGRWSDERKVNVYAYGSYWDDGWWFAGVRKSSEIGDSALLEPQNLELSSAITIVKNAGYKVIKEL